MAVIFTNQPLINSSIIGGNITSVATVNTVESDFVLKGQNETVIDSNLYNYDSKNSNATFVSTAAETQAISAGGGTGFKADYIAETLPGCSVTTYLGTTTQTVNSRFTGKVSGLRNLAYLAVTLESSDQLKGGFPTISCIAQGVKIKTWNGSVWSSGVAFSDNPAACVRDFLINTRYGVGLPESLIDNSSFGEVYDYCDVLVSDGTITGLEKRFNLNFVIDSKRPAVDILQDMCNCFGGFLIWAGNKLKLRVEKVENVVQNFAMDNIVEGSFSYQYAPKDSMINRLKVQYIDPTQNYTKVFAMAEDKIDQDERSAIEGGNGVVEKELSLMGITKFSRASRLANFALKSSKAAPMLCKFKVGIYAIHCEPGDVVSVSHDVSGWVNKPFRIVNMREEPNDEMSLTCKEYNESVYDDSYGSGVSIYSYGSPSLPNKPLDDVTNLVITESPIYINKDGVVMLDIQVQFTAPTSLDYFSHYQIELKKASGSFVSVGNTSSTSYTISVVEAEIAYQVRVKVVSIYGLLSSGVTSSSLTIIGKMAPPENVSYFSVLQEGGNLNFEWKAVSDVDLLGYEIREGSSWESAQFIVKKLPNENTHSLTTFNAGSKTFRIKAVDTSGNYSTSDTTDSIVLTAKPSSVLIANYDQWNRYEEVTFVGDKVQRVWVNAYDSTYNRRAFCLKTQNRWDNSGTWDNPTDTNKFDRNLETAAEQWQTNVWDITAVLTGLHTLDIRHLIGFNSSFTMEYRISDDAVTWSDWKLYVAGYISGRFMQFRGTVQAGSAVDNITTYHGVGAITLALTEQQGLNVSIPSGGSTIAFSPNYTGLQSIVLTTVGSSPLRPRISAQNVLGFTVILENKDDVSQAGNINWRARGY